VLAVSCPFSRHFSSSPPTSGSPTFFNKTYFCVVNFVQNMANMAHLKQVSGLGQTRAELFLLQAKSLTSRLWRLWLK
jgi:hypothetical protein